MLLYKTCKEGFIKKMKQLQGLKLERIIRKYFKFYGSDIKKVTYFIYGNKIEYLINDHYIYTKIKKI